MNSGYGRFPAIRKCFWCSPTSRISRFSPGRYILVLKDQGYDFTIAGKVTDPVQCLERTDAANGEFYSECQKP